MLTVKVIKKSLLKLEHILYRDIDQVLLCSSVDDDNLIPNRERIVLILLQDLTDTLTLIKLSLGVGVKV